MSAKEKVNRWIRPSILEASAYSVPDATGLIKMDAMENPYTWPEDVKQAWLEELGHIDLNRYPDASANNLKNCLRTAMNIPPSISILLGNGSDEIIQILALAMSQRDNVFLAPEPGFVMYRVITEMTGAKFIGIPLLDDFSLDRNIMIAAIEQHQPALVFLAWPNNPTGNLFDHESVLELIEVSPGLVVVDEAYYAYAGKSFMGYLGQYDNLLVMRTMSKLGLAGLRVGVLMGSHDWLDELEKVRLPYNISTLTQKSVEFICQHFHVLEQQVRELRQAREMLQAAMKKLPNIHIWPSQANFILFRVVNKNADDIFSGLKNHGVLIKNLHGSHAMLQDCLRVTVGTEEENRQFIEVLTQLVR